MSAEELLQYQFNVGTAILLTLIGIATLFVIVSAIIVWAIGACHYVRTRCLAVLAEAIGGRSSTSLSRNSKTAKS
jgi:uncharacterized membrane protein YqjE